MVLSQMLCRELVVLTLSHLCLFVRLIATELEVFISEKLSLICIVCKYTVGRKVFVTGDSYLDRRIMGAHRRLARV